MRALWTDGDVRPRGAVCEVIFTHLSNGTSEALPLSPRVVDISVMLREQEESSFNPSGPDSVTSTFAAARSAAAHGDDFTALW